MGWGDESGHEEREVIVKLREEDKVVLKVRLDGESVSSGSGLGKKPDHEPGDEFYFLRTSGEGDRRLWIFCDTYPAAKGSRYVVSPAGRLKETWDKAEEVA